MNDPKNEAGATATAEQVGTVIPGPGAVIPAPLPATKPYVHNEAFKYTIDKKSGLSVEVTAREPSAKLLWERLKKAKAAGEDVFFPEAVVEAGTVESLVAGWVSEVVALVDLVERLEELEDTVFEEDEPPPPPTKSGRKRRPGF